jgi:hypothetical protein
LDKTLSKTFPLTSHLASQNPWLLDFYRTLRLPLEPSVSVYFPSSIQLATDCHNSLSIPSTDHLHPVPPFRTKSVIYHYNMLSIPSIESLTIYPTIHRQVSNLPPLQLININHRITYFLFHHLVPSQPSTITIAYWYQVQDHLPAIPPSRSESAIYYHNSISIKRHHYSPPIPSLRV